MKVGHPAVPLQRLDIVPNLHQFDRFIGPICHPDRCPLGYAVALVVVGIFHLREVTEPKVGAIWETKFILADLELGPREERIEDILADFDEFIKLWIGVAEKYTPPVLTVGEHVGSVVQKQKKGLPATTRTSE